MKKWEEGGPLHWMLPIVKPAENVHSCCDSKKQEESHQAKSNNKVKRNARKSDVLNWLHSYHQELSLGASQYLKSWTWFYFLMCICTVNSKQGCLVPSAMRVGMGVNRLLWVDVHFPKFFYRMARLFTLQSSFVGAQNHSLLLFLFVMLCGCWQTCSSFKE